MVCKEDKRNTIVTVPSSLPTAVAKHLFESLMQPFERTLRLRVVNCEHRQGDTQGELIRVRAISRPSCSLLVKSLSAPVSDVSHLILIPFMYLNYSPPLTPRQIIDDCSNAMANHTISFLLVFVSLVSCPVVSVIMIVHNKIPYTLPTVWVHFALIPTWGSSFCIRFFQFQFFDKLKLHFPLLFFLLRASKVDV